MTSEDKVRIVVVVSDGFPLLSLTLVTEPLRIANRESSAQKFSWRLVSPDGAPCRSTSGITLPVEGDLDVDHADAIMLLASYYPDRMLTASLQDWLSSWAKRGALLGCVDTGATIFAAAGLLETTPAAVHHEAIAGFRERFGARYFADQLYALEGNRCSSAGGVATFDMTLSVIAHFSTPRLSARVAEVLNYRPLDRGRNLAEFGRDWSIPRLNRDLANAIELMLASIEDPVSISEIAKKIDVPIWRLRRLFHKHLGMSAQDYFLELRLDHARNLLRNSGHKVGKIALMSGFPAPESLSRAYKKRYGISPVNDRQLP